MSTETEMEELTDFFLKKLLQLSCRMVSFGGARHFEAIKVAFM
jgi:hypothetical protein